MNIGTTQLSKEIPQLSAPYPLHVDRLLQSFMDAIDDSFIILDRYGVILDCNKAYARHLRISKEDLVGQKVSDDYPADIAKWRKQAFEKVFITGQPHFFEDSRQGHWYDVSLHPIRDKYNSIAFVGVHAKDITTRKHAELVNESRLYLMTYAESHFLYDLLEETLNEAKKLSGSSCGLYHIVGEEFQWVSYTDSSGQAKSLFCKAPDFSLSDSIKQAGGWSEFENHRQAIVNNDVISLSHQNHLELGHGDIKREMVVPVIRGHEIKAILGLCNKPEDYSKHDVMMVSSLADLSWDIAERKQTEERLQINETKLRELNAQKDKFFSIIAHDIKSPICSILGLSELMEEQIGENSFGNVAKYTKLIKLASLKTIELLSNLLEWSRSKTGRLEYNPEFLTISGIINGVFSNFESIVSEKKIEIQIIIPDDLSVYADNQMLCCVLRNLISNAIKYTRNGGRITLRAVDAMCEHLISVSDNGVGMSAQRLDRLFSVGENESTRGTCGEQGNGLGLILCQEFVEKHGGRIWAESEIGIGSTFTFTLPVKAV